MPAAAISKIRGAAFEHESASFLLASRIGEAERHEVLQFAGSAARSGAWLWRGGQLFSRIAQAGWKFDEALKLITPAADSAPHRKRARSTADDEAGGSSGAKKRALTVTLKRKGGTLGISVDPNNHQITNVVEGGAGDTAGLCVGDFIAEVNGKIVDDRRLLWQAAACSDGGD